MESMSAASLQIVLPAGWRRPRGISHGICGEGRRILLVDGQLAGSTGADATQAGTGLPRQFGDSLRNVVTVVRAAGGQPFDIAALRVFVTDIGAFKRGQTE